MASRSFLVSKLMWAGANGSRRATTGRDAQRRKLVARRRKLVVRRRVLVTRRRVLKVRKLWKVISHLGLVEIGRLRCFLASTENVDFKKHLKCPIGPIFECDMTFSNYSGLKTHVGGRRRVCTRCRP